MANTPNHIQTDKQQPTLNNSCGEESKCTDKGKDHQVYLPYVDGSDFLFLPHNERRLPFLNDYRLHLVCHCYSLFEVESIPPPPPAAAEDDHIIPIADEAAEPTGLGLFITDGKWAEKFH
ncbi:hypothetical protein CTI12_AA103920 [Artemisia annua]|uniref:Uncharacterized protein n=1 Tax=Artemisia annua TaxID=35608 RepID=A0A2U1PDU6_ARTAN|nr:hypothetical protein CTI12_AA103920 [Artemisia annua]